MKAFSLSIVAFLLLHSFLHAEFIVEPYSSKPNADESTFVQTWSSHLTQSGQAADETRYAPTIPFSFLCGDRSSREWVNVDNAKVETGNWANDVRVHTLRWKDDVTSLSCEMHLTEYRDFPAMTWTVHLKNEGTADTGNIHDFKTLDTVWKRKDGSMPILYRSQGSDGRTDDFVFVGEEMRKSMWGHSRTVRMDYQKNRDFRRASNYSDKDSDTRPSATWMPFFNLQTGPDGLIVGIGWNGHWFAEIGHDGNGTCPLSAGMEHLNTKLLPSESIRSPLILVFYWSGELMHGQNMFRQFVLKHFTPQEKGRAVRLPACCPSWGGTPTQVHLDLIQKIIDQKLPYDYYWIDAGWYGKSETDCPNVFTGDWGTVGDWIVNRHRHPDTLKPISDAIKEAGMQFLLWFEPIRTTFGTEITLKHPEWFLKTSDQPGKGANVLLDLGNPDARKYIVDTISGLITENGIDCYREDFNIDPFPFWTYKEEPDRIGMREIRFVEGSYAMWDELRNRHPNLLIDNCASGGRRIELEAMKRSVPLWRTDYNCFPYLVTEATQAHTFGIAHWVPTNSISPFLTEADTYQCRSGLSSGVIYGIDEVGNRDVGQDFDWQWQRERIEEAKQAMPYFYGDFYPLTSGNYSHENWLAYHFYLPEKESGLIVAFRRSKSDVISMTFDLTTLKPDALYEFEDVDTGETKILTGAEVRKTGFTVSTKQPRESRLVYYRRVNHQEKKGKHVFKFQTVPTGTLIGNVADNINQWSYDMWLRDMGNVPADYFQKTMPYVKYVQLMTCAGGTAARDLFKDPNDRTVMDDYEFSPLIAACKNILRQGLIPHLKLGNVPLKYSDAKIGAAFSINTSPPSDYRLWHAYVKAMIQSLVDEFGLEMVRSWRFGSVTEYENADWFTVNGNPDSTRDAFITLYDYTVDALEQVLGNEICVGAHSMTVIEGLWDEREFIAHCARGTNKCTGATGTRLSFLAASYYDNKPGTPGNHNSLSETIALLRETAEKEGLNNLFYGFDEGRILSGLDGKPCHPRAVGYTWQAAYDARMYHTMLDEKIDYFSHWAHTANYILPGAFSVSAHTSLLFYRMMGAHRLPGTHETTDTEGEVGALAALNQVQNKLYLLFYAYDDLVSRTGQKAISCEISGLQKNLGKVTAVKTLISDDSNFFDEYLRDREKAGIRPEDFGWSSDGFIISSVELPNSDHLKIFQDKMPYYETCAELKSEIESFDVSDGVLTISTAIPVHGVVLYEVSLK